VWHSHYKAHSVGVLYAYTSHILFVPLPTYIQNVWTHCILTHSLYTMSPYII